MNAPLVSDFLTNNVRPHGLASKSQTNGHSLCLKAFLGVPGQQQLPTPMSSHLRLVRLHWAEIGSTSLKGFVGVIRAYDFTIKRGFIAPDGVNKSVILINGQFPAVGFSRHIPQLSFEIH